MRKRLVPASSAASRSRAPGQASGFVRGVSNGLTNKLGPDLTKFSGLLDFLLIHDGVFHVAHMSVFGRSLLAQVIKDRELAWVAGEARADLGRKAESDKEGDKEAMSHRTKRSGDDTTGPGTFH